MGSDATADGTQGRAAGGGYSVRSVWADTCVCANKVRCKCLVSTRGMKGAKRIAPAGACKRATARSAALSESQWQRSKKWSKRSANIFSGTATGEEGLFQSSSCCGSQNQQSLVSSLLILTTATRSPRFLCHWQRSDRSPCVSFSSLSFVTGQKIGPSETAGTPIHVVN